MMKRSRKEEFYVGSSYKRKKDIPNKDENEDIEDEKIEYNLKKIYLPGCEFQKNLNDKEVSNAR